MKKCAAICFLSILTSVSAFACPSLSGAYRCEEGGKRQNVVIEQSEQEPIRYIFIDAARPKDKSDYVDADGKEYPVGRKKTVRAWCEGDTLKIVNKGTNSIQGKFEYETSVFFDEEKLVFDREDKSDFPIGTKKIVCTRR